MKITILAHDPLWATQFAQVKASPESILSDIPYLSIVHVGSTSIPDLPTKPMADIDIIIPSSGYTDCGEMNVPGRFAFRQPGFGKGDVATRTSVKGETRRNTYVMIEGCVALKNHLDIKRVLIEDGKLRGRERSKLD